MAPMLVIGINAVNTSCDTVLNKIGTYSVQIMDQIAQNARIQAIAFENMCDELMLYKPLQEGFTKYKNLDDYGKGELILNIKKFFDERFKLANYITDIEIVTKDNEVLYSQGFYYFTDDITKYVKVVKEKQGIIVWSYSDLKNRNNLVVGRAINSAMTKELIGYAFIAINERCFSDIYRNIDIGEGADIFIMDGSGTVVSSRNPVIKFGMKYKEDSLFKNIFENMKSGSQVFTSLIGGERYMVAFSYIKNTDWYMVATIPFSYLNSEIVNIRQNILLVGIISLFFVALFTFLISKSISETVNKLINIMKKTKGGNFAASLESGVKNEIGYLEESFVRMVKQIKKLIEQVNEEQINKREIEIQMLQAQINPHFLFNTLNTLKWTAVISQADSVAEGLGALAELMRNTILDKKELISIREEFKNIENYAVIQKIRYGASFNVEFVADEELLDCKILKFLLQPIVENSIIHGLEGIDRDMEILISCERKEEDIVIEVKDNGCGFDEDKIVKILEGEYKSKHQFSSIGIWNVNERIRLNFGDKYGLTIRSQPGKGTNVTITIPLIKNNE